MATVRSPEAVARKVSEDDHFTSKIPLAWIRKVDRNGSVKH